LTVRFIFVPRPREGYVVKNTGQEATVAAVVESLPGPE